MIGQQATLVDVADHMDHVRKVDKILQQSEIPRDVTIEEADGASEEEGEGGRRRGRRGAR